MLSNLQVPASFLRPLKHLSTPLVKLPLIMTAQDISFKARVITPWRGNYYEAYGPPESEGEIDCVVSENIHTSPTEGIFSKTPHPSGNFLLTEPPGNSNPFCGGSTDIFWTCTFSKSIIPSFGNAGFMKSSLHQVSTPWTLKSNGSHCVYYLSNIFKAMHKICFEDLKIGEYQSTGEYFTVVVRAFSDTMRQRCASKII